MPISKHIHQPDFLLLEARARDLKWCAKCRRFLSFSEFYKDDTRKDGLSPTCKECRRVRGSVQQRAWREKVKNETLYQKLCDSCESEFRTYDADKFFCSVSCHMQWIAMERRRRRHLK